MAHFLRLRMHSRAARQLGTFCWAVFGGTTLGLFADPADTNIAQSVSQLKKLTLEELLNQTVTVVSREPEKIAEAASAVQVITGEDIRRSGATSLPEALRLAPNLQVAQVDSR